MSSPLIGPGTTFVLVERIPLMPQGTLLGVAPEADGPFGYPERPGPTPLMESQRWPPREGERVRNLPSERF